MRFTLAICLLILSLTLASCGDREAQYIQHMTNGDKYCAQEEYRSAISAFKAAVHLKPNSADAHFKLGKAYWELGDFFNEKLYGEYQIYIGKSKVVRFLNDIQYSQKRDNINEYNDKAQAELIKTLEIDRNNPEALIILGDANKWLDNQDSEKYYLQALKISPKNPLIYVKLYELFVRTGDLKKAKKYIEKAIELKPDYIDAYIKLSTLCNYDKKGLIESINIYRKLVDHNEESAEAHYLLSDAYRLNKDKVNELKELKTAIDLNPRHVKAQLAIGWCYLEKKDFNKAEKSFLKVIEVRDKSSDYESGLYSLFKLYESTKEYPKLLPLAKEMVEIDPIDAWYYDNLAKAYYLNRDYANTIINANTAIKLNPKEGYLYINLANAYLARGDFDKALTKIEKCKTEGYTGKDIDNLYNQILTAKVKAEKENKQK